MARVRFADDPELVLHMYDADTVPENNRATLYIQDIYSRYPDLKYLFVGMSNLTAGHSKNFVADSPRENIRRTANYNDGSNHGSPQISFRLSAYDKLQEIAGWRRTGFHGDEDRDTAIRLIYQLGSVQEGLLLDGSVDLNIPTSLTADRLDGSVDSAGRKETFAENGVRFLDHDLARVFSFQDKLLKLINRQNPEKKQEILEFMERSRLNFKRRQEVQSRFNRMLLSVFLQAFDDGLISLIDGEITINQDRLMSLRGGTALLHYVNSNKDLVVQVLSSEEDVRAIKYYLGRADGSLSATPTPFQLAVREYVGEVRSLKEMVSEGLVWSEAIKNDQYTMRSATDHRTNDSRQSLMHSVLSEILALAQVYKAYFETNEFLDSRDDSDSNFPQFIHQWPNNPAEQELDMNYGTLQGRMKTIRDNLGLAGEAASLLKTDAKNHSWVSQISLRSFPIFELFKKFFAK